MSDQSNWVRFEANRDNHRMNPEDFSTELETRRGRWWFPVVWAYESVLTYLQDTPLQIKWFFQRRFRGFDDRDVWGLDSAITRFVYPRLKEFVRWQCEHGLGTPLDFAENPVGWIDALGKMEKAFESMAKEQFVCGFDAKDFPSPPSKNGYKDPADYDQAFKEWRRTEYANVKATEEGLALFAKYYQNLWD